MRKKTASLHNEQETAFIVTGDKGKDWNSTKENFFHLAKTAFYFTVSQCDKYIVHDDMRDPDATIDASLRDNIEPVIYLLQHCERMGMPGSISQEIKNCDWMKMTKKNVILALCAEAKNMRLRKIRLRKRREVRKGNSIAVSAE